MMDIDLVDKEYFLRAAAEAPLFPRLGLCDELSLDLVRDWVAEGLVLRIIPKNAPDAALHESLFQACHWERSISGRGTSGNDMEEYRNYLLMVAAHDVRSPISIISGYADILLETETSLSERGRSIVARTLATSERLLTIVDNLLDITALEEGRVRLHAASVNIKEMVVGLADSIAGLWEDKNFEFSMEFSDPSFEMILDQDRVCRVLQNILVNAVKYAGEPGKIHLFCETSPGKIMFRVSDNGPGIPDDQKEKIFERFSRLAPEADRGNGLGLAISRAIVTRHGGEIHVEDAPGGGSVFIFTIQQLSPSQT